MAKLTQNQLSLHQEAEDLLKKPRDLNYDESRFVMANWLPDSHSKTKGQAFFTPPAIASIAYIAGPDSGSAVDLAAGIGTLAYYWGHHQYGKLAQHGHKEVDMVAVEINPDFIRVGKKLVPNIQWVEGDIFDVATWHKLDRVFDYYISNPPFGPRKTKGGNWLSYKGNMAMSALEVGLRVTTSGGGVAILPQALCPFNYSGNIEERTWKPTGKKIDVHMGYKQKDPVGDGAKFWKMFPDLRPSLALSVDTTGYGAEDDEPNAWRSFADTSVTVEVVDLEWPIWEKDPPGLPVAQMELAI